MSLAMQRYETWRSQPGLDATLSKELSAMEGDAEKILDSFGCDLAFGTAGLRGVLGAGTSLRQPRGQHALFQSGGAGPCGKRHDGLSLPEIGADAGAELCRALLRLRRGHQRDGKPQPRAV